jgi:hypothetical protein
LAGKNRGIGGIADTVRAGKGRDKYQFPEVAVSIGAWPIADTPRGGQPYNGRTGVKGSPELLLIIREKGCRQYPFLEKTVQIGKPFPKGRIGKRGGNLTTRRIQGKVVPPVKNKGVEYRVYRISP